MRTCSKSFALEYPRVVQMYDVRVNASSAKLEADVHSGVKSE
jgi:hypothetical protein